MRLEYQKSFQNHLQRERRQVHMLHHCHFYHKYEELPVISMNGCTIIVVIFRVINRRIKKINKKQLKINQLIFLNKAYSSFETTSKISLLSPDSRISTSLSFLSIALVLVP